MKRWFSASKIIEPRERGAGGRLPATRLAHPFQAKPSPSSLTRLTSETTPISGPPTLLMSSSTCVDASVWYEANWVLTEMIAEPLAGRCNAEGVVEVPGAAPLRRRTQISESPLRVSAWAGHSRARHVRSRGVGDEFWIVHAIGLSTPPPRTRWKHGGEMVTQVTSVSMIVGPTRVP